MLFLKNINITQFKNYTSSNFNFTNNIVGICGLNGKGKTNLLDAIYYCCFTKSYFAKTENLNIQFNQDGFRLEASFEKQTAPQHLVCIYRGNNKKELFLNEIAYDKMSQHIGHFTAVMIAPDDIELITGVSEVRRRFIDTIISQIDADYLIQLIKYNKILLQRNSLLKQFTDEGKINNDLLDVLDSQLAIPCNSIHQKRKIFCTQFIPLVNNYINYISNNNENIIINYNSQLNEQDFNTLLSKSKPKDIVLQRTNVGIHKDDIVFYFNDQFFKNIASQGQRKSLLFALKLAEFEILKESKGFAPLLFLDDVFEKLDNNRMNQLLQWVCLNNKSQVFITDTDKKRLENTLTELKASFQIIEL